MSEPAKTASAPAWNLDSEHSGPFLRLERLLRGRLGFTLVVLEYSDSSYRDKVVSHLGELRAGVVVDAGKYDGDFAALEKDLARAGRDYPLVQVVDLEAWPLGLAQLWQAFNYHREQIADRCPVPLLLWIARARIGELALEAPDLWAWRSGVFDFGSRPQSAVAESLSERLDRGRAAGDERRRRISEIDSYLAGHDTPSHTADLSLLTERGELLLDLGDSAAALQSFQTAVRGYEQGDDRSREADAKRRVASVLAMQGEPKEALRLLRDEALPVYDDLKDLRQRALTMGQIADVVERQGDLDEALRIRREDELPVYEQLGDVRSRAVTSAKLGLLLSQQGQRAEAEELLSSALADAESLRIPEAETIRSFLAEHRARYSTP